MSLINAFRHGQVCCVLLVLFIAGAQAQQVAPSVGRPGMEAYPQATPVNPAAAPAGAVEGIVTNGSYRLQANDLVRITVFEEDDLTTETRISKGGNINFPLIGSVQMAGRTVDDATSEIRARLDKDYIVNPQVTLVLVDFAKQYATVLGEVQKPGEVEIPPDGSLDLLGAIALAGGYTRIADPAHVIVRRMVNGHDAVLKVNAKQLSRDSRVAQFHVYPGDSISVGQSFF